MPEPYYVIDADPVAGRFRVVHASGVVLQALSVSGVLELFERR